MGVFFALLSVVLIVVWIGLHPRSFFAVGGVLLLLIGGGVWYLYHENAANDKRYAQEAVAEGGYFARQTVSVTWAGVKGGCYIDKPWLVEMQNDSNLARPVSKLTVSVTFHLPNYAEPLHGFSIRQAMEANERICINGPTWDKYPAVRVQALAGKPYGDTYAKFIETLEKPKPMKVGETVVMPNGDTVTRTE